MGPILWHFHPDGMTLAIGANSEGTVKLWDIETKNISTISGYMSWVRSVALSPNGAILASGSDGEAALWNVATGRPVAILEKHGATVHSVSFSPDGKMLASSEATVKLWDVATGENITKLVTDNYSAFCIVFTRWENARIRAREWNDQAMECDDRRNYRHP